MLYPVVRLSGMSNLLDFEVEARFLLEEQKKSPLQGRGCIFSRSFIVQVVAFRLFSARCSWLRRQLGSPTPRPGLEDMAVVQEAVEHGRDGRAVPEQFSPVLDGAVQCEVRIRSGHVRSG
jgi:hypothetical protein